MALRHNRKLESEGAEFLVLVNLLIEEVSCFNAYVNFLGYDLVATNPATSRIARIQVRSRWAFFAEPELTAVPITNLPWSVEWRWRSIAIGITCRN